MDIHKPKAWHSVREFLKEIGVIVLGARGQLDGDNAGRLIEAVNRARNFTNVRTTNSKLILGSAAALGVKPKLRTPQLEAQLAETCHSPASSAPGKE